MYFQNLQFKKLFSRKRVIIFDLNGLIIDDEKFKLQAFNEVLKKFKIKLTREYWINQCVGYTELNNFKKILADKKIIKTDEQIKKLILAQHKYYKKLIASRVKKIACPEILNLIQYIKAKTNKKIAIATSTNKKGYELVLGKHGLNILKHFDYIVCGEDIKKSKPNPEIYFKVKRFFKVSSKECLVFEDAEAGVLAAKNAKMSCVAIPNDFTATQNFKKANIVIY